MIRPVRAILVLVCAVGGAVGVSAPAAAQSRAGGTFGVGLVLGDPTGVTAEYNRRTRGFGNAIEAAVGIDTFDDDHLYAHLVWKFYLTEIARGRDIDVPLYAGVGPWLAEAGGDDDLHVGARAPFGIALDFRHAPVQVYFELAFVLRVVDDVDAGIGAALGFRYYF